jgi:hypothetical protein
VITVLATIAVTITAWLTIAAALIWVWFRKPLSAEWREPVLRVPVLILESDDWGPGPEDHAQALRRLSRILESFRDGSGRHPVMTLGVVLSIPDAEKMLAADLQAYHRLPLSAPRFASFRSAIEDGVGSRVFSLQLHGMEHYWPPALLAKLRTDDTVRNWLTQGKLPNTEELPAYLQSRWTDAGSLPSRAIPSNEVGAAVAEEVAAFSEMFGSIPEVVVPPTFVWDDAAERAWATAGVRVVVTPGRRSEGRDSRGRLTPPACQIRNGERSAGGMLYVVRNDYFEPAKGHRAHCAVAAVENKTRRGRPTLLETHRFNFTGTPEATAQSCAELSGMLGSILERFPDVRFMSTAELANHMLAASPDLVETRFPPRLRIWLVRIRDIPRFRKLAVVTGAGLPLWVLGWILAFGSRRQVGQP